MVVHQMLLGDWMTNQAKNVEYLANEGVRGLVYSGDKDFVCNWRGGEAWTESLWKKIDGKVPDYEDWTVDGEKAGEFRH